MELKFLGFTYCTALAYIHSVHTGKKERKEKGKEEKRQGKRKERKGKERKKFLLKKYI